MGEDPQKVIVIADDTDGIVSSKKYEVKVISRQDPASLIELTAKGVEVVQIDYSNHAILVKELQEIHTVIVTH
jgi:hypothetical protein